MFEHKPSENQPSDKICEMDFVSDSGANELKSLVKNSMFVCRSCGRAAANEENLCQPEWIFD
jgi:hypothetical protein